MHNCLKAPRNSLPSPTHTFSDCLFLIIFWNAPAVSVAFFVFKGSTRKYLDGQSTATKIHFMLRLYFASLSTCVKSNDQISIMSFTKTLSLGILIELNRTLWKTVLSPNRTALCLKVACSEYVSVLCFHRKLVLLYKVVPNVLLQEKKDHFFWLVFFLSVVSSLVSS